MVICIDEVSEIPIYKQIRNQIVLGISDGSNYLPCAPLQKKSGSIP